MLIQLQLTDPLIYYPKQEIQSKLDAHCFFPIILLNTTAMEQVDKNPYANINIGRYINTQQICSKNKKYHKCPNYFQ